MAVRSQRVNSTQAFMGRVSNRSEISTGDGLTGFGTSSLWGCGLATYSLVLAFVVGAFLGDAGPCGAGFLLLAFLLVISLQPS
jgi:hypothetical protein